MAVNIVVGQCIQELPRFIDRSLRQNPRLNPDHELIRTSFETYRRHKGRRLRLSQLSYSLGMGLLFLVQALLLLFGTSCYIVLLSAAQNLSGPVLSFSGTAFACLVLMAAILTGIHLCCYYSSLYQSLQNCGYERELLLNTELHSDDLALLEAFCLPRIEDKVS